MIGRFVKGRVFVFIDVANIFYSQKTLDWRISYELIKRAKYIDLRRLKEFIRDG